MAAEAQRQFDKSSAEDGMTSNVAALEGNVSNYYDWNLEVFKLSKGKNILDLGCGPGMYFENIKKYSPSFYLATDYSDAYVRRMQEKIDLSNAVNCKTMAMDLLSSSEMDKLSGYQFDYTLLFDVLEHIEDHERALKNISSMLKKTGNGQFCIRVPALQAIYGENDAAIGHYRRYSLSGLRTLLQNCGFKIEVIRYQNMPGILPWYIIGKIKKRTLAVSEGESKTFDKVVPIIKAIESVLPVPLGLSVYAKCRAL